MATFKKGDVVQVKSGSPSMTVADPAFEDQYGTVQVLCVYFDGMKKLEAKFDEAVLHEVEI